jgi:hypothetical protein
MRMNDDRRTQPALQAEQLLAQLNPAVPEAPPRLRMLQLVYSQAKTTKENPMTLITRAFTARPWPVRIALAGVLLLGLIALSVLLPGRHFVPGPQAAFAGTDGYILLYEFQGQTLEEVQPLVEQLKKTVQAFKEAHGLQVDGASWAADPNLGVMQKKTIEKRVTHDSASGDAPADETEQQQDRLLCYVQLEDPELLDELQAELAGIAGLPAPQVVDATWFNQEGLPIPGEDGIRVGLGVGDKSHVFAFPAEATEEQIEASVSEWLSANHPGVTPQVDVTITKDGDQRKVEIRIQLEQTQEETQG